ncbi:MAG: bifunctional folylpolyglutamate synthase/dihydrofolate synthase, partial [Clostridiaceae bacterium]|nr:bifunctional folylpolyglutamate synthase/dihydrofolate synthase [Clostridiaceae bacterium]
MEYIHEVGNFGSNYGLERTQRLLELLGNPHKKLKLIHIAGTNGKGSITAMITEMLIGKGYKVGMYTSPFLEEFEERIQINGVNIPKNRLAALVKKIREVVDKVIEEGLNHPTEFEIITALMLLYFSEEKVDYGVIEVGLGGRLDSTNVITPILSVIASISLDHTNLLGTTIAEIAAEKAGIIKGNIPVVIYPQKQDAYEVLKDKANEMNSKLYEIIDISAEFIETVELDRIYQKLKVKMDNESFYVNLPLLGEHQINNFLTALKAFKIICEIENVEFNHQEIIESISKVKWIGRLEVMNRKPLVVIDGAHNIQGIQALRRNVEKYFKYKNVYLLLG